MKVIITKISEDYGLDNIQPLKLEVETNSISELLDIIKPFFTDEHYFDIVAKFNDGHIDLRIVDDYIE